MLFSYLIFWDGHGIFLILGFGGRDRIDNDGVVGCFGVGDVGHRCSRRSNRSGSWCRNGSWRWRDYSGDGRIVVRVRGWAGRDYDRFWRGGWRVMHKNDFSLLNDV